MFCSWPILGGPGRTRWSNFIFGAKEYGQSPLYLAAVEGHLEAIKVPRLPQQKGSFFRNLRVRRCQKGPQTLSILQCQSFQSFQVLLWWGADVSLPCHGGATAYEAAKSSGHTAVCQLLKWELWKKFSFSLGLSDPVNLCVGNCLNLNTLIVLTPQRQRRQKRQKDKQSHLSHGFVKFNTLPGGPLPET